MAEPRAHKGGAERTRTFFSSAREAPPDAVVCAVRAAAEAVLSEPEAWRRHALGGDEAAANMEELLSFVFGVAAPRVERPGKSGGEIGLALRMQELLSQSMLRDSRGLEPEQVLDVLRRLDAFRSAVYPDNRQNLAFLLTGANALDLVVEFAHDLRSPLTSIMFLAETLRKGQSGEISDLQRQQLGIVYSAALSMVGVANDLMDLATSRAEDGWRSLPEESFSLQTLVESVRDIVAPMAEQKRLGISFFTPRQDLRIGKPVPLTRVLLNLTSNAIKFTETGRVEIVVGELPGERVEFSVRDTGPGISEQQLISLNEMFTRSRSATGYHFSESGLGLSICRRMVDLMGGQLQVDSQPGEGTRFYFSVPLPRA